MTTRNFNVKNGLTAGNITLDATTNTTTTSKLTATGNVAFSGANVSLGAVANLHINGGTNGQVLTTDGTGNLAFTTPSAASGGNIYVYTRSASIVHIPISLGQILVIGRSGNVYITVQA